MTKKAAYTVRNNINQVKEQGIKIVSDSGPENFKGKTINLQEVNIDILSDFIKKFGDPLTDIDYVAIAVQDHGIFPKKMSNREFRMEKLKELLKKNPKPESLAFTENEIPSYYPRMRSAMHTAKRHLPNSKILVMDTAPDAILGCIMDPKIGNNDPILAVNLGNGHTMAAIISNGEITALLEHHTRFLNSHKLANLLKDFTDGKLNNELIFNDNGHGMFYLKKPPGYLNIKKIVVTGPNRNILSKTKLLVYFASPGGDVMMAGPIGLVEATKRKYVNQKKR
jgi:uncharacterized protein (DUF1786 family)